MSIDILLGNLGVTRASRENSKSEALNSKQIQNSNVPNQKRAFRVLDFENWDLFRNEDFGFPYETRMVFRR